MKIVVAIDKFKESLTTTQAAHAVKAGFMRAGRFFSFEVFPMADGGDGTLDALKGGLGLRVVRVSARDPLGGEIRPAYGFSAEKKIALIEMARVAGLALIAPRARDALRAGTYGLGQVIADAARRGAREIVLGIGGSATSDAGTGLLTACGIVFRDARGRKLSGCGATLSEIAAVDVSGVLPALKKIRFTVLSDVNNPLYGKRGAAYTYAPQKGARPSEVAELDRGLRNFARIVRRATGVDAASFKGAGAAGGVAAGLRAFFDVRVVSGIEYAITASGLDGALVGAALAVTGEGRLDGQSALGKTVSGVARAARRHRVPVIALAGSLGKGWEEIFKCGVTAVFPTTSGPMPLAAALRDAAPLLRNAAENAARFLLAVKGRR